MASVALEKCLNLRCEKGRRWDAIEQLVRMRISPSHPVLLKLVALLELPTRRPTRTTSREAARPQVLARRRLAAITLTRLCAQLRGDFSARLQSALARGLALALPEHLSRPHVHPSLLTRAECATLLSQAQVHAAKHGWGSLHRKYPTVDIPVSSLACARSIEAALISRAFPAFVRHFGAQYGPVHALRFRDLFVAKYEADGQAGLDGHVDAALLSLVLQLNSTCEFDGGGTYFEHVPLLSRPEQGGATLFLGKVYHAAAPITRGTRYVLVALVRRDEGSAAQTHFEETARAQANEAAQPQASQAAQAQTGKTTRDKKL